MQKINLDNAAFITYGLAVSVNIHQNLWDGGGDEADIHKGQIREEEVNGCVQVGVCDNDQDDE
jgi:hypothetical protein